MMNMTTKKITTLGMLCALAVIVNLLIHFPLIPSVEFLSYDAKDVIIVIGGFIYGAGSAFIMSVITSLLEIMYRGGNLLDVLMNVISTCTFACVAAWIYKRDHTREGAFIGLGAGARAHSSDWALVSYAASSACCCGIISSRRSISACPERRSSAS